MLKTLEKSTKTLAFLDYFLYTVFINLETCNEIKKLRWEENENECICKIEKGQRREKRFYSG